MKHLFILCLAAAGLTTASVQVVLNVNNNSLYNTGGRFFPIMGAAPVSNTQVVNLKEGSPFFLNEWGKSKVVTAEGAAYDGVKVKLNLLEHKVHYMDSAGNELVVGTPLREIIYPVTSTGKAYHFVSGNILPGERKGWFLLLVNDTLSLVKGFKKSFEEHRSYNSSTEYSIQTNESYHVFYNNQEYGVKKPSDFADILPAKKAEIQAHSKKISSKLSKDEQLTEMAAFCNTLL